MKQIIAFLLFLPLFTQSMDKSWIPAYVESEKKINAQRATQTLKDLLNSYTIHDLKIDELYAKVPELIKGGADLNSKDNYHHTLLMRAVKNNREDILILLLNAQVDPNITTNVNETALYFAVREGNINFAQLLLFAGSNPNIVTASGDTPLFQAIQNQQRGMVQLLLDNKADLKMTNAQGLTPLEVAQKTGNQEIVNLIRNKLGIN